MLNGTMPKPLQNGNYTVMLHKAVMEANKEEVSEVEVTWYGMIST